MNSFLFYDKQQEIGTNSEMVAVIESNITAKKDLLNELSEKLHFPDYFGKNWDALNDCLLDFHWIKERDILIVHKDIPMRGFEQEQKLYIRILTNAILGWQDDPVHTLNVAFPTRIRSDLEKLMKE